MAAEAAVLGTHAIFISTIGKYCGVFYELKGRDLSWFYEEIERPYRRRLKFLQPKT